MKTETMTIAVPVVLYAKLTRKEIKDLLLERLTTVSHFDYYPGKRVNMGIRIEAEIAAKIRANAERNEVAITEYTASLLSEGDKPCLENRRL